MRVACFGGTFDPPHPTHLHIALTAQRLLALDSVLFVPVGRQPLKQNDTPPAPYDDRVAMLRLALAGHPGLSISTLDAPRPEAANYTVDLLARLRPALPEGAELYFLSGADSFLTLPHWREPERLLRSGELLDGWILAARPGFPFTDLATALPTGFTLRHRPQPAAHVPLRTAEVFPPDGHPLLPLWLLTGLAEPTAATAIREQLAGSPGADPGLHPKVLAYIREHGLYAGSVLR